MAASLDLVIFDCDGVLVDSEPLALRVCVELGAELGWPLTEKEIIDFCAERLARFKCLRSVDIVPALPRNPTGKILKKDLRAPFWDGHDRSIV